MAKLIGYCNMKNKNGKVLYVTYPLKNGVGECYTEKKYFVYDEDADKITPDMIGRDIRVNQSVSLG